MNSLVLVIIIIVLAFILGIVLTHQVEAKKKKREITSDFLESKLSDCSDLTTCNLEYVNLVKFEEGSIPLLTRRRFSMIYNANIRAGIDLSQAEITVGTDQVTVHMPETVVQAIDVDTDSLRFYDEHNALFNWNDKDDISSAIKAAREDVQEHADINKLKAQASRQAAVVVKKLILPLIGERKLVIEEQDNKKED